MLNNRDNSGSSLTDCQSVSQLVVAGLADAMTRQTGCLVQLPQSCCTRPTGTQGQAPRPLRQLVQLGVSCNTSFLDVLYRHIRTAALVFNVLKTSWLVTHLLRYMSRKHASHTGDGRVGRYIRKGWDMLLPPLPSVKNFNPSVERG